MTTLIIGGNSGLGLELGKLLLQRNEHVYVTGRSVKDTPTGLTFVELNITHDLAKLKRDLSEMVLKLPAVDMLVYAAGFIENGHISELSDDHLVQMVNVGMTAPAFLLQRILQKQGNLAGFIAVTSTSQWRPRELEPMYTGVKAGLAMLAQSVSLDPQVRKTLVVGPAGMNTNFFAGSDRETSGFLSPELVAEQVLSLWDDAYTYRLARILRAPVPEAERVQVIETRV